MKLTFRYNSMLNFIQVSFCFLLFFLGLRSRLQLGSVIGLGLRLGFGFGIDNRKIFQKYLIGDTPAL